MGAYIPKHADGVTDSAGNPAANVVVAEISNGWGYGNWPNTLYVDAAGSAGTNDDDVVYTANDVSMYNTHYVECTAGTIDVDVSIDGTNWIAAVVGRNIVTTGVFTQVNEAASGVCLEIKGKFRKLRVNQKGATASNARIAHTVA